MKRLLLFVLVLSAFVSCNKVNNVPRLVIISLDGMRWQELFGGAQEELITDTLFVPDFEGIKVAYWRETEKERRELLFPFIWNFVPENGYIIGNRSLDSRMEVANEMWFSYPGYAEIFTGWADDKNINNNNPKENPNTSILEVINKDPRYKGSVMMLASWESIPYALGYKRGGFPASAGHEPCYVTNEKTIMLQGLDMGTKYMFDYSERSDVFTYGFALEVLKEKHPKVFYVAFGDTDMWPHEGKYDLYLQSAQATDGYIRNIVETCEADPFYKGKTTYMIITDHGRGRTASSWTSHGRGCPGSNETWFMMFGKDVPVLGETSKNGPFYNKQLAGTIAEVLDVDFTPDNGVKSEPFDPIHYEAPEPL